MTAKNKKNTKTTTKITGQKPLKKDKKDEATETAVLVSRNQQRKKSPHIINLKNPYQELFNDNIPIVNFPTGKKLKSRFSISSKSPQAPRSTPKKPNKSGVDFISDGNFATRIFKKSFIKEPKPIIYTASEKDMEDIFSKPGYWHSFGFYIPRNWYKNIAAFVTVSIILILPLQAFTYYQDLQDTKDRILLITNEAIENLKSGQEAVIGFDLDGANLQLDQAKVNFTLAQNEINALNVLTSEILKILPGKSESVSNGLILLEAGEIIADAGQILINSSQNFLAGESLSDYYKSLASFESALKSAIDKFDQAKIKIEGINPNDLPAEHRETFTKVLTYLPTIKNGLIQVYDLNNILLKILGHSQWQRYLLVFLNNNELRGSGGFMGSFGIIDIDRGKIKNLEIPGGGTYDIQGQLIPKVISPEPLHLINPRWEFQDANWWPDFPTTAKKIQWFYQNANGPSVDGVITMTSTFMEKLLEVFGPISMPDYDRDITSENFVLETQKIVEIEYDKEENRPKQFIADLAPKLLERIFSMESTEVQKLFEALKNGLNEKQVLVYFNDDQIEDIITKFDWDGRIKQTDGDYLSVVHSNIAGGKTDGVIKETIEHLAEVQADGSIINTIKLIRRHTGIAGENIFTGVQNNSYVRFYVPLGSTLIEAEGFKRPPEELFKEPLPEYKSDLDLLSVESKHIKDEKTGTDIYKESGKTVFGNWLALKPGEIGEATIKYRLPFKLALEGQNTFYYSLLAQKQSGSLGSVLKSYLKLNDQLKPLAKFPADLPSDDEGISFNATLVTDQFYGVVLISE